MSTPLSPAESARLAAALPDELRAQVNPQLELTKLFMRCGPRARGEFLQDAKAADPQLFREVMDGSIHLAITHKSRSRTGKVCERPLETNMQNESQSQPLGKPSGRHWLDAERRA